MSPVLALTSDARLFDLGPLGGLAFASVLFVVATCLGWRALRLLGVAVEKASELERLVLACSLGLGVIELGVFALGMAHLFRPALLGGLFLLFLLAALVDVAAVSRAARAAASSAYRSTSTLGRLALVLVAAALLVRLPAALVPVTDPDGIWYHMGAPQRWLASGYLDYLPTLNMTLWPMGTEMLYGLGLVFSDAAPKAIHFGLGSFLILALFAFGNRLYGRALGFLAAVCVVLVVPGTTMTFAYVDASISFQIACALLAFTIWLQTENDSWLPVSALCAGVATSCKLTGAPLGVLLAVAVAVRVWRTSRDVGLVLKRSALFGVLAAAPVLPFFARAGVLTGNPLYPFFSGVIATRDWNPSAGVVLDRFFKYVNWGQERQLTMSARVAIHHAAAALGAVVAILATWYFRARNERTLAAIVGALFVIFLWSGGPYTRFLLPVISVAAVFAFAPFVRLVKNAVPRQALCAAMAFAAFALGARWVKAEDVRTVFGRVDRETFLRERLSLYPLWRYASDRLPADARIMIFYPGVYYIERTTYLVDPVRDQFFHYDTWEHFRDDVVAHRVCYVLAPRSPIPESMTLLDYQPAHNAPVLTDRLLRESGRELASAGDSVLYELGLPSCELKAASGEPRPPLNPRAL